MALRTKAIFFIWYFVLWGVISWAIFEFLYPLSLIAVFLSVLLLAVTGVPLFRYLRRNESHKKRAIKLSAFFPAATIVTVSFLAPPALVSAKYKSTMQWYINDLKSQGFNVKYVGSTSIITRYVPHEAASSYSEFILLARNNSIHGLWFYGEKPEYFIFFVSGSAEIVPDLQGIADPEHPLYTYWLDLSK